MVVHLSILITTTEYTEKRTLLADCPPALCAYPTETKKKTRGIMTEMLVRRSLLVEFVETYVPLLGNDLIEFQELIHTENQYEEVEKMVTVYEQMGIVKGIEKGKQNTLVKLLAKKFGSVPEEIDRAIRSIVSIERLDELLLSVLDAKSLNGFLG